MNVNGFRSIMEGDGQTEEENIRERGNFCFLQQLLQFHLREYFRWRIKEIQIIPHEDNASEPGDSN